MIGVFRAYPIAANSIAAVAIVLLAVNPTCDLTPICLLLALATGLWFGPVVWRKINPRM